jgi:hypothetical protein
MTSTHHLDGAQVQAIALRADERRRIAAVIRTHLDDQGLVQARSAGSSATVSFSGWSLRNRYQ